FGQATVVPQPFEGHTITLQTVGPDTSMTVYAIQIHYDQGLAATEYRSYYLRAFTPASTYVSIRNNGGAGVLDYKLSFNGKFGSTAGELIREIQGMEPEY